jgi:E3 ubiquitin-protein ligase XIAP
LQHLNFKSEAGRRKTFKRWPVPFMDKNRLAAAGFYYTIWGDVVCCAFCRVEVRFWKAGHCPLKDYERWRPSCGFVKGFVVGNIPVDKPETSQEATRSNDVCGSFMKLRPNSRPEQSK